MASTSEVIVKDPDILGGTPVFRGTRVPLQALFDSLEGGETLEEFLEGFPTVTREMAIAPLEEAHQLLPETYSRGFSRGRPRRGRRGETRRAADPPPHFSAENDRFARPCAALPACLAVLLSIKPG